MTNTIEKATETQRLNDEQMKVADELRDEFWYYVSDLMYAVHNQLDEAQWYRADVAKDVLKQSGAELSQADLIKAASSQEMPPLFARLWSPEDGDKYHYQDFLDNELKILRAKKLIARYDPIRFAWKHDFPMPANFVRYFTAWINASPKAKQRMTDAGLTVADVVKLFGRADESAEEPV